MKQQTLSSDIDTKNFGFHDTKEALLKATNFSENEKHPVLRVRYKVTFYWK